MKNLLSTAASVAEIIFKAELISYTHYYSLLCLCYTVFVKLKSAQICDMILTVTQCIHLSSFAFSTA